MLMAEGLVEGRSGSGTYVRERPVPRRVARSGYRPDSGATPFRQEQADFAVRGGDAADDVLDQPRHALAQLGVERAHRAGELGAAGDHVRGELPAGVKARGGRTAARRVSLRSTPSGRPTVSQAYAISALRKILSGRSASTTLPT